MRAGLSSRFEHGTRQTLMALIGSWREMRPDFTVTIVQPGYSKSRAARPHLELLAATESYLMGPGEFHSRSGQAHDGRMLSDGTASDVATGR